MEPKPNECYMVEGETCEWDCWRGVGRCRKMAIAMAGNMIANGITFEQTDDEVDNKVNHSDIGAVSGSTNS